jgi:hypothetical protein
VLWLIKTDVTTTGKPHLRSGTIRVLRIKYGAGEKSVIYSHPRTGCSVPNRRPWQLHVPGPGSEDLNANAASVQHMDAHSHLPESTSKAPFEAIAVELKG